MKHIIIIISFLFSLSSCNEKVIYYEYNGRIVTCIDKGDEMYFYDGKYDKKSMKSLSSYIYAKKGRVDHIIEGCIFFGTNGKTEIYPIFGYFSQKGETSEMFAIFDRYNIDTTYIRLPLK